MDGNNPYESPKRESFALESERRRAEKWAYGAFVISLVACASSWAGVITLVCVGLFDYLPQDTASSLRSAIALGVGCALMIGIPALVATLWYGTWLQRCVAIVLAIVMLPLYHIMLFGPR